MDKIAIFDMDGVIIDTEPIYMDIDRKIFKSLGIDVTAEEQHSFVGIGADRKWTTIMSKCSMDISLEELMFRGREEKFQQLKAIEELEAIPGIEQLLKSLKTLGVKVCMGSSSPRRSIELILSRLNLMKYFDFIVSGEDVVHGKPAPDIFLKSAQKFDIAPSKCTVVEDSANGACAAKIAGMKCVGFKNASSGNQDLSKTDLTIDCFSEDNINKIVSLIIR
jgi:HAD superfamily hydrolase (TIGR01509 family)